MRILAASLMLAAGLLSASAFANGLEYVKQTIYGMDCAPCAYGIEQGLKKLDAAGEVTVSLNDGFAEMRFGEESRATLADIRRIIRENGFTPKEAEVRLTGTIVDTEGDGKFWLTAGQETFTAILSTPSLQEELPAAGNEPVTVTGTVAADRNNEIAIRKIR